MSQVVGYPQGNALLSGSVTSQPNVPIGNNDAVVEGVPITTIVIPSTGGSGSSVKQGAPSEYSLWQFPFNQSGGVAVLPKNYADNGIVGSFGPSATAPWANAGYVSSSITGGSSYIEAESPNVNLSTDSWIFRSVINRAAAAGTGTDVIAGFTDLTLAKPGMYFAIAQNSHASAANKPGIRAYTNGVNTLSGTFGSIVVADGADHDLMIAFDATTGSAFIYVDGVLGYTGAGIYTANVLDQCVGRFRFGGALSGSVVDCKFYGAQFLKFASSGLPVNTADLAKIANSKRRTGISKADPVFF